MKRRGPSDNGVNSLNMVKGRRGLKLESKKSGVQHHVSNRRRNMGNLRGVEMSIGFGSGGGGGGGVCYY